MRIHDVNRGIQKNKKRKRIGRGPGSGHGKTAARGHKGAKSRSGYSRKPVFQGGAMPLVRRVPKRGFNNKFALTVAILNVSDLDVAFEAGADVNPEILKERGILKGQYDEVKILGDGEITKSLNVQANRFSKSAQEKIEKAGGKVEVVRAKVPVEEKKKAAKEANNK